MLSYYRKPVENNTTTIVVLPIVLSCLALSVSFGGFWYSRRAFNLSLLSSLPAFTITANVTAPIVIGKPVTTYTRIENHGKQLPAKLKRV